MKCVEKILCAVVAVHFTSLLCLIVFCSMRLNVLTMISFAMYLLTGMIAAGLVCWKLISLDREE